MRLLHFVVLMLVCSVAVGQQVNVREGVVRDPQLHFSVALPPTLKVFDVDTIAKNLDQPSVREKEFRVFSAKALDGPNGEVLLAERIGTDRKPALTKPDDFLDALVRSSAPGLITLCRDPMDLRSRRQGLPAWIGGPRTASTAAALSFRMAATCCVSSSTRDRRLNSGV